MFFSTVIVYFRRYPVKLAKIKTLVSLTNTFPHVEFVSVESGKIKYNR
jgi:hypothetical protein